MQFGNHQPYFRRFVFAIALAISFSNTRAARADDVAAEMAHAASLFLKSLEPADRELLTFPFDDQLRKGWQFIPMDRSGIPFGKLKHHQHLLATSLIQTALSHRGYATSTQVMTLEAVLNEMENGNPKRDASKYHLYFFGKPTTESTWAWRIEGHHLSINFTIVEGKHVSVTPAFFGASPAEVRLGRLKGLRTLADQEDLGRKLIQSLSASQKTTAIISPTAPPDVINGPGQGANRLQPEGIAAEQLTEIQQAILRAIIESYLSQVRRELALSEWKKIDQAGFDQIKFAWAGKTDPGKPHYYRIQGPTFILEDDNSQNDANHVHIIWRDFQNDFGADLLRLHYQSHQHAAQPTVPKP